MGHYEATHFENTWHCSTLWASRWRFCSDVFWIFSGSHPKILACGMFNFRFGLLDNTSNKYYRVSTTSIWYHTSIYWESLKRSITIEVIGDSFFQKKSCQVWSFFWGGFGSEMSQTSWSEKLIVRSWRSWHNPWSEHFPRKWMLGSDHANLRVPPLCHPPRK